jgi:hypothetical protein
MFSDKSRHYTVLLALASILMFCTPANAQDNQGGWMNSLFGTNRGSTVIEGPGIKIETKRGLFGSQEQVYQDALGNRITRKRGWFGRENTDSNILGAKITRNGRRTQVLAPNGTPIITRNRGWFGGETTNINANGLLQGLPKWLGMPATTTPSTTTP